MTRRDEVGAKASSDPDVAGSERAVTRHEEELQVGTQARDVGGVRVRKRVESERADELVPREIEHADIERERPADNDSGEIETLPDGSISIPIFEEELVVTKRLVVRERVVIRKRTITEHEQVSAELRKERVEIDTAGAVDVDDER